MTASDLKNKTATRPSAFKPGAGLFKALAASPLVLALVAGAATLASGFIQPGYSLAQSGFGRNAGQCAFFSGGWSGWFGGPMMILFWVVVIIALVMLIRWLIRGDKSGSDAPAGRSADALEILKARYARGDIERDEFLRLKQDLTTG